MSLNPKLKAAIDHLRIADVTLKSINAFLCEDFDPMELDEQKGVLFQTVHPICKAIRRLEGEAVGQVRKRAVFEMFAGLRVLRHVDVVREIDDDIEKQVCATIECHFLVAYDESEHASDSLDEEALSAFAQHNVPFNVWPYWREITQSACGRMGLPRIVLPTHRLHKSATVSDTKDGAQPDDRTVAAK
ncbi:MAG TPA: hypothetical protein VGH80_01320 [Xanthomonadaceae bacterium]|jgi:hypothetical protein